MTLHESTPDTAPASAYMPSLEMAARSLKVEPIIAPIHSDAEIEAAIIALGREPGGGLVVMPNAFMTVHRAPIISAAARNNVPAVYWLPVFARDGGLLSYGVDLVDTWRRAATYVDRILRGTKPAELPVQLPTKFEMVDRLLCRSHPARREAGRSPGAVADQVRDGREPQDRHGARPCHSAVDSAARR